MTDMFAGLEFKLVVDDFVRDVAKFVALCNGFDPGGMQQVPSGVDSDGQYTFEEVPNYDRFEDDARHAIEYIMQMSSTEFNRMHTLWLAYESAQERVAKAVDDAPSSFESGWLADNGEDEE